MVRINWYLSQRPPHLGPGRGLPPVLGSRSVTEGTLLQGSLPARLSFWVPGMVLHSSTPRVGLAWQSFWEVPGLSRSPAPLPASPRDSPRAVQEMRDAADPWRRRRRGGRITYLSLQALRVQTRERRGTGLRPQGAAESRGVAAERGPRDAGAADGRGPAHVAALPVEFAVREGWLRAQAGGQRAHGREKPRLSSGPRPRGGSGGWWSETLGGLWPPDCSRRSRRSDRPVSPPPPQPSAKTPRLAGPPWTRATHTSLSRAHRLLGGPQTPRPAPSRRAPPPRPRLPGSAWRTGPRDRPPGLPRT